MENVVIELTINKWLLFVCFVIVWMSFISNVMSLYERYKRKKQENKQNETIPEYWGEYNKWFPPNDNTGNPPSGTHKY